MSQYGEALSDQAERTDENPLGSGLYMRILVELQVLSMLLANQTGTADDLARMRRDVARSIT